MSKFKTGDKVIVSQRYIDTHSYDPDLKGYGVMTVEEYVADQYLFPYKTFSCDDGAACLWAEAELESYVEENA
jgi:hypothetical protein